MVYDSEIREEEKEEEEEEEERKKERKKISETTKRWHVVKSIEAGLTDGTW